MEEKIFECPPQLSGAAAAGGGDQLPPCFVHFNWDSAVDQNAGAHFESALSSMVSSPSSTNPAPAGAENLVIRELIGRLGSICNSGEISPQSHRYGGGAATSCYSTPLNSPPKLNLSNMADHLPRLGNSAPPPPPPLTTHLMAFAADPEFAERAARLSCFGGRCYGGQTGLSRVSSSQSLMAAPPDGSQLEVDMRSRLSSTRLSRSSTPDDAEFGGAREEEQPPPAPAAQQSSRARNDGSAGRKRKTAPKGKAKAAAAEDSNAKRSKSEESAGAGEDDVQPQQPKAEPNSDSGDDKGSNSKPPAEPPKQDYIHVRARRGQATDSHSLAERVRRENRDSLSNVSLDYALFRPSSSEVIDPNTGLVYTNMFDAQLDALYFALMGLNYKTLKIMVTESGWPSKGSAKETVATPDNAQTYNTNLIRHVINDTGTPAKPGEEIDVYIFSLFNENRKPGLESERNWGLFFPDQTSVYSLDLTGRGNVDIITGANITSSNGTWCIASSNASDLVLQSALDWACGSGNVDCSAIQPSQPCFQPDTLVSHASYAFNSYFQQNGATDVACSFGGSGVKTTKNPSYDQCLYLTSGSKLSSANSSAVGDSSTSGSALRPTHQALTLLLLMAASFLLALVNGA